MRMTKAVLETYDYQPFGELLSGSSATTHKFNGKERGKRGQPGKKGAEKGEKGDSLN